MQSLRSFDKNGKPRHKGEALTVYADEAEYIRPQALCYLVMVTTKGTVLAALPIPPEAVTFRT